MRAVDGPAPEIPEEITGTELDKSVRAELAALRPELATEVARRLVMVAELLDDDPETAWRHAAVARDKAARLAAVREAVGLAAYATGRYAEALAELRTVRRLTGSNVHLPVMADCERGLGRPERALDLAVSQDARQLDFDGQVEMLIVAAGARADMGQLDAAVVTLQVPELKSKRTGTWQARLRSAYADALTAVGRTDEAKTWLALALEADVDGEAGIAERLAEEEGLVFEDLAEGFDDDEDESAEDPAAQVDDSTADDIDEDDESDGSEDGDGPVDVVDDDLEDLDDDLDEDDDDLDDDLDEDDETEDDETEDEPDDAALAATDAASEDPARADQPGDAPAPAPQTLPGGLFLEPGATGDRA